MARDAVAALGLLIVPGLLCLAAEPQQPLKNPSPLQRYESSQIQMGTLFRLVFYAPNPQAASTASDEAFARIAELNAVMSDYRDDSELTRLSQSAGGPPVPVSDDLFEVLHRSLQLSIRSGGAFDVTVGPLVRLWRRARRQKELPAKQQIEDYLKRVGYPRIKLDPDARTVQLLTSPMRLDLGGIAKGYACEEALKVLAKHGVDRALVDGGGDMAASGPPPGEQGWTVAMPGPTPDEPATILLKNAAVATSGDASQFVEIDGVRYSHIVDPATGIGLTNRVRATVLARDGATADALASAVCVLGPVKGTELVDSIDGAAAFVVQEDDAGKTHTYSSKRWPPQSLTPGATPQRMNAR